jgi:hypothetical protein
MHWNRHFKIASASPCPDHPAPLAFWRFWTTKQKKDVVAQWAQLGSYFRLRLKLGSRCPPLSTIRGWRQKVISGQGVACLVRMHDSHHDWPSQI